jgi:hypothetical protein
MIKSIVSTFFIFSLFFSASSLHEYYVSLTEITFVKEKSRVEIISRLFYDDLEDVLQERYFPGITIDPTKENTDVDTYLKKYFDTKLKIDIDGQPKSLKYLGYRFDEDRVNIFLVIDSISSFNTVKVENLLLTDLFETQQNIVHAFKGKQKESVLLNKYTFESVLKFD